jgi:hypothetical protein
MSEFEAVPDEPQATPGVTPLIKHDSHRVQRAIMIRESPKDFVVCTLPVRNHQSRLMAAYGLSEVRSDS